MGFFFRPDRFERETLARLGRIEERIVAMSNKQDEILALSNQINDQTNALALQEQAEIDALDGVKSRLQALIDQIAAGQSPTLDGIKTVLEGVTGRLTQVNSVSAANKAMLESWGQDSTNPFPTAPPPVTP